MQNGQQRSRVNVVVAEANRLNCQLVESAFRPRRTGVIVLASAIDSQRALALFKERAPDIAVLSSQLEEGPLEGYQLLRELRSLQSKTWSIMLLTSREPTLVVDAFRFGAHGVIFRDEPLEALGKCIHAVHGGQVWADSQLLNYLLEALTHAVPFRLHNACCPSYSCEFPHKRGGTANDLTQFHRVGIRHSRSNRGENRNRRRLLACWLHRSSESRRLAHRPRPVSPPTSKESISPSQISSARWTPKPFPPAHSVV